MFWTIKLHVEGRPGYGPHEAFGPYRDKAAAENMGASLRRNNPEAAILIAEDLPGPPDTEHDQAWTAEEILAREG